MELMKHFGWTYDYLLWKISWLNIQLMLADQARVKDEPKEKDTDEHGNKIIRRDLTNKDDILNYIKGLN